MKTRTILISFGIFIVLSIVFPNLVLAIEYGGVGGKPAYPREENPRTQSIFIFDLKPGEKQSDGVLVVNNTQETKTLVVYATDSQKSTDGSFACEQFEDVKDNVGSWIILEKS